MDTFTRLDIAQIIRNAAHELGVPLVAIFREAKVDHTNMNKWEKAGKKKALPNRRTENKILDAIERLSKKSKSLSPKTKPEVGARA